MTPSQQAKAAGLKSLAVVTRITGVSKSTLFDWHKNKPRLFAVVLKGCREIDDDQTRDCHQPLQTAGRTCRTGSAD